MTAAAWLNALLTFALIFGFGFTVGGYLEARRWRRFGSDLAEHLDRVGDFLEREHKVLDGEVVLRYGTIRFEHAPELNPTEVVK